MPVRKEKDGYLGGMNRTLYEWNGQFAEGDEGEKIVESYLRSLPETTFVWRMLDVDEQYKGVDIAWITKYSVKIVEVKTDYKGHITGNLFIETVSQVEENKKGWFYTSKADWLLYLFRHDLKLIIAPFDSLRRLDIMKYPEAETSTKTKDGRQWKTRGRLIVKAEFLSKVKDAYEVDLSVKR